MNLGLFCCLFFLVAVPREASPSDATPATLKMKAVQERKTRKSTASTLLKKTILDSSGRASRIENSSARLLVSHGEHRSTSSVAVDSNSREQSSLLNNGIGVTPMDVDELPIAPPPLDSLATQVATTTAVLSKSTVIPSSKDSALFAVPGETLASNFDQKEAHKQAQGSCEPPATNPSSSVRDPPVFLSPEKVQLKTSPALTVSLPHTSVSNIGEDALPVSVLSELAVSACSDVTTALPSSVSTPEPTSFTSASTYPTLTATAASPKPSSPASSSSCAVVAATLSPSNINVTTPSKAGLDPSNIMPLKIIISDNQDEDSSTDAALNQAISSISVDKIPTIYLSSPAKSPGGPGTPKANFDEVAQAVSGLQSSETHDSPVGCKAGAVVASPLSGTSQIQQRYVIQLPVDAINHGLQGPTASYFLVTPTSDVQTRQVLLPTGVTKGQSFPNNQCGVTTAVHSQGYSTGEIITTTRAAYICIQKLIPCLIQFYYFLPNLLLTHNGLGLDILYERAAVPFINMIIKELSVYEAIHDA